MSNVGATGTNHGVRHAYAYGHAKKNIATNFKEAITTAEDKPTVAKEFKNLLGAVEVKPTTTGGLTNLDTTV